MTAVAEAPQFQKVNIGTDEFGRPKFHHSVPEDVEQFHGVDNTNAEAYTAYYSPHFKGQVQTSDGTLYDMTPDFVLLPAKHVGEVDRHIGKHFEVNGHPMHTDGEPFVYQEPSQIRFGGEADDGRGGATMANASAAAENAALNGLDGTGTTNVIPDVSLHSATPGTTGASENANTGSYARQACTWNAASGGSKTNSTALTFTTAGSVAVTSFGTWSSATYGAGTYALGGALTSSVTAVTITFGTGSITISIS